jgi:hypothetical protein
VRSPQLGSQRSLAREDYLGAFLFARFDPLSGWMSGWMSGRGSAF